jgi:RNA processing factor Prp31
MIGQCANDVHAYLNEQRAFVVAQIEDQSKARKIRINWPRVQQDYDTLKGVLEPWYKRTLTAVHDVVQDILDTRYELTGTDERTYLKAAALNIKGINEYTRTSVAKAIATSVELDETVEELAMRINDLYVFSESRALEIARTELAQATNLSQIESYKASDVVVGVRITDGDQDSVCAALNGRRVKIAEARSIPPLGHPNCVRRFWHILDAAELAESEAA